MCSVELYFEINFMRFSETRISQSVSKLAWTQVEVPTKIVAVCIALYPGIQGEEERECLVHTVCACA